MLRGKSARLCKTIDDNVVIARNTTCVLNGTTIKGNVTVRAGATLYTNGALVIGNVQAYNSFLVDLKQGTRVNGDVQGKGTRSVLVRGGTRVGGSVQLVEHSTPPGVDALLVNNVTVVGDVQVQKGTGRLRVLDTDIDGNLQFVENNGVFTIRNNRVGQTFSSSKTRERAPSRATMWAVTFRVRKTHQPHRSQTTSSQAQRNLNNP